jgi:Skp family chaperone for outer membrane proteins
MFSQKKIQTTYWMVILIVALSALGLGYRATARSVDSRPPTVVVVFNLQQVFDNFVDRAILGAGYKELEAKVEIERKRREEHVQSLIAAYEEVGDEDKDALFDQIQQAVGEAEKYVEFTEREKDIEKSLILQSLFRDIKESVATIAAANNYDLVIASDEGLELNSNIPSRIADEKISMHRVYYANKRIDITEQIVTQMNLELDTETTN